MVEFESSSFPFLSFITKFLQWACINWCKWACFVLRLEIPGMGNKWQFFDRKFELNWEVIVINRTTIIEWIQLEICAHLNMGGHWIAFKLDLEKCLILSLPFLRRFALWSIQMAFPMAKVDLAMVKVNFSISEVSFRSRGEFFEDWGDFSTITVNLLTIEVHFVAVWGEFLSDDANPFTLPPMWAWIFRWWIFPWYFEN